MANNRKRRKKPKKRQPAPAPAGTDTLEQLYAVIEGHKRANPKTSDTARLLERGRDQIAKKLGEEAVETLIEGMRGDRLKLVLESADLLYHLTALWAVNGVKPKAVWSELARRVTLPKRKVRA
jgi:phosphoribosyl-ATP pyrophosphohydrolase